MHEILEHYRQATPPGEVNVEGHRYRGLAISANNIPYQTLYSISTLHRIEHFYFFPYRHVTRSSLSNVLVIGAGTGNDVGVALSEGARHVDAVEIDPVIQDIGRHYHPDHPYQDPRVIPHLDDGRHFLRTTDRKFDLVIYALVDSLILHSSYANIRLESYLFTQQAFDDVKRVLKPDGTFVMYNQFRQGWIVERIAAMAERTFGCPPLVLSLPYEETLRTSSPAGFTMIIAGCNSRIADAFSRHKNFWLNTVPVGNLDVDGFTLQPEMIAPDQRRNAASRSR